MSDTQDNPTPPEDGEPPRDTETGKYVRRHGTDGSPDAGGEAPDKQDPDKQDKDKEKEGKKRWLLLLLLLLILALLVCAGFAYNLWWGKKTPDPAAASPSPTGTVTAAPSPTQSPTPSPSPSPTVKTINMPDVVGMPAADAKVILEGAGFTSIKFVTEAKPDEEQKILVSLAVTKQSVTAGTAVPADTALVITCKTVSNGKG